MFTYANKRGVEYYVHETRTKGGARRYVVKRAVDGALADLPTGMEIVENVNGQVSLRAARPRVILLLEEQMVRQALTKHGREKYRVEVKDRDIIIHEPLYDAGRSAERLMNVLSELSGLDLGNMIRQKTGKAAREDHHQHAKEQARQEMERDMRYWPVLRFRLDDAEQRLFSVERMSYRGEGGWLWLKTDMSLAAACEGYVPLLGTERLFDEF